MSNIFDDFPSKYLKASDINGDTPVTMNYVNHEQMTDGEMKPVLYLQQYDKGIVLNKTNATNIANLYGVDYSQWGGKPMTLTTAMVDFQGRSQPGIRLYPPKTTTGHNPAQKSGFVSGTPGGDPRGDTPPPASEDDYGAVRG